VALGSDQNESDASSQTMTVDELYQQCQAMSTSRQRATGRRQLTGVRLTRLKSRYKTRRRQNCAAAAAAAASVAASSAGEADAPGVLGQLPDDSCSAHVPHIPQVVIFAWNDDDTAARSDADAKVVVVVVVTFFNHDFVNCKATLILSLKNLQKNKIQYKPK